MPKIQFEKADIHLTAEQLKLAIRILRNKDWYLDEKIRSEEAAKERDEYNERQRDELYRRWELDRMHFMIREKKRTREVIKAAIKYANWYYAPKRRANREARDAAQREETSRLRREEHERVANFVASFDAKEVSVKQKGFEKYRFEGEGIKARIVDDGWNYDGGSKEQKRTFHIEYVPSGERIMKQDFFIPVWREKGDEFWWKAGTMTSTHITYAEKKVYEPESQGKLVAKTSVATQQWLPFEDLTVFQCQVFFGGEEI